MQTAHQSCFRPVKGRRDVNFAVLPDGWNRDKQMKGAANETSHPLPQSIALQKELQTRTCNPNPTGDKINLHFSSGGIRSETKIGNI
jgi:hypothetical protein